MAVTELRVHGVGGSTPENVLNTGPAERVAGDAQSGFYAVAGRPGLEGYSWGSLTSGNRTRALWLLMLPFTLVNAAFWMGTRRDSRVPDALVRLLALSMTGTAVLAAQGVGTDLLGWQCSARSGCRDRHTFLRFLGEGAMATPGRRLVVGTLVPLGVLGLMWFLSRRTAKAYEEIEGPPGGGAEGLSDPTFWNGASQVARLRALHVAVGLVVVGTGLVYPALDRDWHRSGGLRLLDLALLAGLAVVLLTASVAVCLPSVVRRDARGERGPTWPRVLPWVALVLVLGAVADVALVERDGWRAAGALPGYDVAVTTMFLLQLLGVAVLALVGRGLTQAAFAALGLLFAAVFSAGLAFRVADWLDGGSAPTDGRLVLPVSYGWAAVGVVAAVVPAALALAVVVWRTYRAELKRAVAAVRGDYGQPRGRDDRVAVVARARAKAKLTDPAIDWVTWLTGVSLLAAVASMGFAVVTRDAPSSHGDALRLATLTGTWAVSGVAALLVALGLQAYRRPALRRTVGILWDLGTFWPRAAHPLAPPSYAERVVPDLAIRVRHLATTTDGVVLSGHSQGSVLSAAVVLQLPPDVLTRVRLLTHGSPLARLYGRVFPRWFGPTCLAGLEERVGWANLWRATDPIGGPVDLTADVALLRDPPQLEPPAGDPAPGEPRGHSDFDRSPEYAATLARLASTMEG